jgi:hypothetical protein
VEDFVVLAGFLGGFRRPYFIAHDIVLDIHAASVRARRQEMVQGNRIG